MGIYGIIFTWTWPIIAWLPVLQWTRTVQPIILGGDFSSVTETTTLCASHITRTPLWPGIPHTVNWNNDSTFGSDLQQQHEITRVINAYAMPIHFPSFAVISLRFSNCHSLNSTHSDFSPCTAHHFQFHIAGVLYSHLLVNILRGTAQTLATKLHAHHSSTIL